MKLHHQIFNFHTIPISSIDLSRNNWYFVALKWSGGTNTFFASDGGQRDNLSWRTSNRDGTAGLSATIDSREIQYDVQGLFWFRLYGDEIVSTARSTSSTSSSTSFSLLNSVSGGPAPKDSDIVDTSSAFIGSVSKYTLSTDISAGQPVCVDISANGPICAKACDSNTLIQDILGIAIETKLENEEVDILTNGYITAKYETQYGIGTFIGDTAMAQLSMGRDSTEHGESNGSTSWALNPVRLNNGTITRTNADDPITVTGPIKFLDDGGTGNYNDNRNIREEFDAGPGNTFLMRVNSFRFETPGSGGERYFDWLRIQYSEDYHWENLNQRIAPEISSQLYFVDNDNFATEVTIFSQDLGGNDSAGGSLALGADEGSYFPHQYTSSARNVLENWNGINARYIRFIFHSDDAYNGSGFDIDLNVTSPIPLGPLSPLDDSKIGSPLYLRNTNYSEVTDNDASGNVLVGYIAGTDVSDNGIYMRTLSFPQSSSAFSRIITTAPTAPGIMGEIRFNTSNNKMYIWNGSAWRAVDTSAS